MASSEYTLLDDVDRGILQILQRDARHSTAIDIGEQVGVSDGTVRNRIAKLEERDIIEGYVPLINYAEAGFQLQIKITCSSRIVDRETHAWKALQYEGVIEVSELMTGQENIEITAVAPTQDDLTRIATSLDEQGLNVESEKLIRHHYFRPFNHFGIENVSGEAEGAYDI